jgi:hypothetical protein
MAKSDTLTQTIICHYYYYYHYYHYYNYYYYSSYTSRKAVQKLPLGVHVYLNTGFPKCHPQLPMSIMTTTPWNTALPENLTVAHLLK